MVHNLFLEDVYTPRHAFMVHMHCLASDACLLCLPGLLTSRKLQRSTYLHVSPSCGSTSAPGAA